MNKKYFKECFKEFAITEYAKISNYNGNYDYIKSTENHFEKIKNKINSVNDAKNEAIKFAHQILK